MRVSLIAFLVILPATTYAYTEGWRPGQPYTKYVTGTSTAAVPTKATVTDATPTNPWSIKDLKFSLEDVLTKGPISRILQNFGFNATAQLEMARQGIPPRFTTAIPLLSDVNYEEDLLREQFSSREEEDERVWAIFCSIGSQDPVSDFFDKTFDGAYNLTVQAGDLKNVRWARIDYLEVTDITTRWGIWKAPVLIIAKDKGRELRFFKVSQLRLMREPAEMREFLLNEEWRETSPWSGPWSPRGSRANILAKYAKVSATVYAWLAIMPRWLMLVVSGTIASTILNLLHGNEEQPKPKEQDSEKVPEWAKEQEAATMADTTNAAQVASTGKEGTEHPLKESPAKGSTSTLKKRKGKK